MTERIERSEAGGNGTPLRNPFRNERDAFRVLVMFVAAGAAVIAAALLIDELVGAILGLVLLVAGLWSASRWLAAWLRHDDDRPA